MKMFTRFFGRRFASRRDFFSGRNVELTLLTGGLALCCMLAGCTVGPKYHAPAMQAPAAYKESPANFKDAGPWQIAQPQDAKLRGDWWTIFHDSELNSLEEDLNINNQNIKQYFQNFMEARALVREARSQYFPVIGTSPSYNRQLSSSNLRNSTGANGSTTGVTTAGQQSALYTLPIDISWAPDLWGRVRNQVRESQYAAQLSAADLENEKLTEQAALAQYFFEIRGQDALIQLYAETVEADKKAVALAQARYETGIDDKISLVEAQNTLQSAQSDATNLRVLRAQYENAIAVLVGKNASTFSVSSRPTVTAPPPIPVGMPSQLLERRPDVAAAERAMASANAAVGIAYSAYYPALTLSAGAGFESSSSKHLFDWPSRFWSIGPSVSETIYDGGLRRAQVQQYVALYNADLAGYRQTVLTAFGQVETSLAAVRILSQQIEQQRSAVESAQTALNLEMARYKTGIDPYLNVVTLQTTLLTDQRTLVNLQVEEMNDAVQLVQALGGGWDRSQLPTPSQVTVKPVATDTTIQQ